MNPKKPKCVAGLFALLLLVAQPFGLASEPSPGTGDSLPPSGSGLARPALFCKWTIKTIVFAPLTGGSQTVYSAPQRRVTTVLKTGEAISQKVQEGDKNMESWRVGHLQYNSSGGQAEGSFSSISPEDPGYVPVESGDFSEFSWIAPEYLIGPMSVGQRQCLVYADVHGKKIPKGEDSSSKLESLFPSTAGGATAPGVVAKSLQGILPSTILAKGVRVACIDAQTRLPYLLQNDFEIRSYEFTTLPPQAPSLPKALEEMRAAVKRANRAFYATPARP